MDHVRYGIIGCGHMGLEHATDIRALEGTAVTAGADPNRDSRETFHSAVDGIVMFEDHIEMLKSGLCDAVVLAAPNYLHKDLLLDIARYPVHVLAEKPLATTVDACREVISAFEGTDRVAWMGLEYRYKPAIARLLDLAGSGEIGEPVMMFIREHRYPFLEKVGDWNRFRRKSGGTLVEKCCHFFDLTNLVAGSRPMRVMASGGQDVNHLDETYDGEASDILDNALVIVDYESGMRAGLDLSMFAESGPWEQEIAVTGGSGKVEAFVPIDPGAGFGRIRVGARESGVVVDEQLGGDPVRYQGVHSGADFLEHVDFLDAIRSGTPPLVTFEEGLWSVAVGQAAHMSIDEGRIVEVAEIL